MISDEKIKRINELAKKSKDEGLSDIEKDEQAQLRKEYIEAVRNNFESTLKSIQIVNKDEINH
ncbi:MAG TPA: DUF896 domain-containing protein [Clostridia bacterium]|nr:DUF896 domain-containing protein [Clostridia bacterium]